MTQTIVGVDIGGTQLRACLSDPAGHISRRLATETRASEGAAATLERLYRLIADVMEGLAPRDIRAIGIGSPGPLNPYTGIVVEAGNLAGWRNIPLRDLVARRFGLSTYLGNDANVAALAEHRFGIGKGHGNLLYMTISTGIGGGVIADSKMLLGKDGFAAEVGFMTLEATHPFGDKGHSGSLENLASGPAIAKEAQARLRAGAASLLRERARGDWSQVDAKMVAEAAAAGDALSRELFQRAGFYLGAGIASLLRLYNPSMVLLGGSVMKAGNLIWQPLRQALHQRVEEFYLDGVCVLPASLGDDVVLLGAVALAMEGDTQERNGP